MLPFALLVNSGALTNFQIVLEASTTLEGSSNIPNEEAGEGEPKLDSTSYRHLLV